MNDKNGNKLSRYPVVKDSFTTANTQPPALDEFVPCSTACNHTKAKTHMDYGFQFNSTMQKMHFAYGIKSVAHDNHGFGIPNTSRRKQLHAKVDATTSYKQSELERIPTVKESLTVQTEGTRNV